MTNSAVERKRITQLTEGHAIVGRWNPGRGNTHRFVEPALVGFVKTEEIDGSGKWLYVHTPDGRILPGHRASYDLYLVVAYDVEQFEQLPVGEKDACGDCGKNAPLRLRKYPDMTYCVWCALASPASTRGDEKRITAEVQPGDRGEPVATVELAYEGLTMNVYRHTPEDGSESYVVVDVDTNGFDNPALRIYVNDGLTFNAERDL